MSYSASSCITWGGGVASTFKTDEPSWEREQPCPFCEEDSLADSVLNHVLARHEMDLVGDGAPEGTGHSQFRIL